MSNDIERIQNLEKTIQNNKVEFAKLQERQKTLSEEKEKILASVKVLGITEIDLENKISELQIEIEKQVTDCEQKLK